MASSSEFSTGFDRIHCGTVVSGIFFALCQSSPGPLYIYAMEVAERKVFTPVEVSGISFALVKDCTPGAIFGGKIYVSIQSGEIAVKPVPDDRLIMVDHIPGLTVTFTTKINPGPQMYYGNADFQIFRNDVYFSNINMLGRGGYIVEGGPLIHRPTGRIYMFAQEDRECGPVPYVVSEDYTTYTRLGLPEGVLGLLEFKFDAHQFWLSDNIILLVSPHAWLKYNVETLQIVSRGKMNGREFRNCRGLYGRYIISDYITEWCLFKVDTLRREKKKEYKKTPLHGRTYGIDEVGGEVVFLSNLGKFMLVKTEFVNNGDAAFKSDGLVLYSNGEVLAEDRVVATVSGFSKIVQNSKSIVVSGKRLPIKDIKKTGRAWMRALKVVNETVKNRKGRVEHLRKRIQAMEKMDLIQIDSIRKRADGQMGLFPDIFRIIQTYVK